MNQLFCGERDAASGQGIAVAVRPLAGGDVEGELYLVRRVARRFDRFQDQLDGRLIVRKIGRKASLVADRGRISLF